MIGTVFAISAGFTVSHYAFDRNKNLITCFYLMMVVVSMIGVSEFGTCLGEEAVKWIGIASVATYFHLAAVHFLMVRREIIESKEVVRVSEVAEDKPSYDYKAVTASFKI